MKALAGGLAEWQQGVKPLVQGGKALQSPETTQALLEGQEKVRNGIGQYTAGFGRLAGGMQQYAKTNLSMSDAVHRYPRRYRVPSP